MAKRLIFLALLAGGLIVWTQFRRPRDMIVELDLTGALPGEIVEADLIVRRAGHVLLRSTRSFGAAGAPGLLSLSVRTTPGPAELEATLVRGSGAQRMN